MQHLLPGRTIAKFIVILNIVALYILTYITDPSKSAIETLSSSGIIIGTIDIILYYGSGLLWRCVWKIIPPLSRIFFPDLNGVWKGKIIFDNPSKAGELDATAVITQDLWSIYVNMYSSTSKSRTLLAYPTTESGNKVLYYVYYNESKTQSYSDYKGTSILTIEKRSNSLRLIGHYFTTRGTKGRIELERVSDDITKFDPPE